MKSIRFEKFGDPAEVLQLRDVAMPAPGPGEVRVRMLLSPVNPSDLMVVRGVYGRLPPLPATPGFEGLGIVDKAGSGLMKLLRGLKPGRRVAVLNAQGGNWQEFAVLPARQLVPVPDDLPDDQVASFFVNPATAIVMTQHVLRVPTGNWLLQTAAASALGRMIIRLGRHVGFRTLNLVRRPEQVGQLEQLGADAVINTETEDTLARVRQITEGRGVPFALDCVGGQAGSLAARCLGPGGRMLVYGTLSPDPLTLEPRQLMMGGKRIEGFWLSEWVKEQGIVTMLRLFSTITDLLRRQILTTNVEHTLPLERIAEAASLAERPGRQGKVLLRCS